MENNTNNARQTGNLNASQSFILNAMLLTDGYKLGHKLMYPENMTKLYSNITPRGNKYLPDATEGAVVFGIQYFIKKYLIEDFNNNFFNLPEDTIKKQYEDLLVSYLGEDTAKMVGTDHIVELHRLGYLPIKIKALPEGVYCPMGVPMLTITNTHPKFAWLTNYLESLTSNVLWHPVTTATVADVYKREVIRHAIKTGFFNPDDTSNIDFLCHDFSMRGLSSLESSVVNGMAFLTSFKGSENVPAIASMPYYYKAHEQVAATVPACYSDDTEILTDRGWKLFKNLNKTELVAQYNEDGSITFVKPLDYICDRYIGKLVHFNQTNKEGRIDILVTPNHRMIRRRRRTGKLQIFEAQEALKNVSYSDDCALITAGYINPGKGLTPIDKLKIAFQADGSYPSHANDYTGEKINGYNIRFSFKKERKCIRLEQLCNEANIKYTKHTYDTGYTSYWLVVPEPFYKDFSWVNIANMSYNECYDFIQELQYWDGSCKHNSIIYSSINKQNIDIVQAIAVLCGYKGHISTYQDNRTDSIRQLLYTITLSQNKQVWLSKYLNISEEDYDGYVYCVSVPSKMLVVRRNNKAIICGNTEHSVECTNAFDYENATEPQDEIYFKRMLDKFKSGIVSIVSDGFDYWHFITKIVPKYKNEIMQRNGRVVIRPDSGDPVKIICGDPTADDPFVRMGSYEFLWNTFGGTYNEKGYKVLDNHIGILYGDSINMKRQKEIYKQLEEKGFAGTNLILGCGSFGIQMVTRDQMGIACKSTYYELDEQVPGKAIYKDPKTVCGTPKKSHKGLLKVVWDDVENKYVVHDNVSVEEESEGELITVFENGKLLTTYNLTAIRYKRFTNAYAAVARNNDIDGLNNNFFKQA